MLKVYYGGIINVRYTLANSFAKRLHRFFAGWTFNADSTLFCSSFRDPTQPVLLDKYQVIDNYSVGNRLLIPMISESAVREKRPVDFMFFFNMYDPCELKCYDIY